MKFAILFGIAAGLLVSGFGGLWFGMQLEHRYHCAGWTLAVIGGVGVGIGMALMGIWAEGLYR